jgi:hypothetical protein
VLDLALVLERERDLGARLALQHGRIEVEVVELDLGRAAHLLATVVVGGEAGDRRVLALALALLGLLRAAAAGKHEHKNASGRGNRDCLHHAILLSGLLRRPTALRAKRIAQNHACGVTGAGPLENAACRRPPA